jgi:hypothetical protein
MSHSCVSRVGRLYKWLAIDTGQKNAYFARSHSSKSLSASGTATKISVP